MFVRAARLMPMPLFHTQWGRLVDSQRNLVGVSGSHKIRSVYPGIAGGGSSRRVLAIQNMAQMPARQLEVLEQITLQSPSHVDKRLDFVIQELFPQRYSSVSGVKKAIRRKEIHVNGAIGKTNDIVKHGDLVQVVVKVGNGAAWPDSKGKPGLDVAFEDDHMACVVKPQGLATQGKGENTVQGRVKYCLQPSALPGALFRPHHVHRLDVVTGGLLLVAKTRAAGAALAGDLAAHNMQKRYLALLLGRLEGSGMIDHPLEGKSAVTLFRVEAHSPSASFGCLTWVSLWPKTGRTHQLRKHCAYIGHPILGDMQYKHHRKAECQVTPVQDVQQYLPQFAGLTATHHGGTATAASTEGCLQEQQHGSLEQQEQQQHYAGMHLLEQWKWQQNASEMGKVQQPGKQQLQGDLMHMHAAGGAAIPIPHDCIELQNTSGTSTHKFSPDEDMQSIHSTIDVASQDGDAPATGESVGGCRQQGQQLLDGSSVRTCLWAVQLQLLHPITREFMDLNVEQTAVQIYDNICSIERPLAVPRQDR